MIDWNRWNQYQQVMTPWHWGFVIVAVSFAIWLIVWLRSYFREDADDADETLEMLTQFLNLHQEGGLSDDEFRLIKSRLAVTAQGAVLAGQTKSNEIPGNRVRQIWKNSESGTDKKSHGIHATEENEEKSERMTDDDPK